MTIISKFISVDPNNLPDEEVLAINDEDEMLTGGLFRTTYVNSVEIKCVGECGELYKVTAYIPVSQLVKLYRENNE